MDEMLRFGYGTNSYTFPYNKQVSIQGDFGDAQPRSAPILGLSGGAYLYGFDPTPNGSGNAQGYFWLFADSPAEMAAKRQAILQMLDWGPKHLIKRTQDNVQMWTWGVVTNVDMAQSARNVPHRQQLVQLNFHCPTARWYGHDGNILFDSPESLFQDGLPVFTAKIDRMDVGDTDTVEITNIGSASANCYVRWEAPSGISITNPTLTRNNEYGQLADSLQYTDTLAPDDVVDIDGRGHLLFLNDVVTPSYSKITALHGGWLQIPPGTHTLTVSGTFSGGDGKLTVDIWDTYR